MHNIFNFLRKLKKNNNREWFDRHREEYSRARAEFEVLCDSILPVIRRFDKAIAGDTRAADCIFRIYRDIRFSKDKTPYKTHFGAGINPGGRKSVIAGYYLHAEPGASFAAGGVWNPEPSVLQSIRQEIDYQPAPLIKILRSQGFRKYFSGLDEEGKLKAVPRGYDKTHPQIELLKHRHFIVSRPLSDALLTGPDAAKKTAAVFRAMYPLMQYLRVAQDHD